jgi:hypothetical protein
MLDKRYSFYYTNNQNSGNSFLNMIYRSDHASQSRLPIFHTIEALLLGKIPKHSQPFEVVPAGAARTDAFEVETSIRMPGLQRNDSGPSQGGDASGWRMGCGAGIHPQEEDRIQAFESLQPLGEVRADGGRAREGQAQHGKAPEGRK